MEPKCNTSIHTKVQHAKGFLNKTPRAIQAQNRHLYQASKTTVLDIRIRIRMVLGIPKHSQEYCETKSIRRRHGDLLDEKIQQDTTRSN